jgi:ion channel-forming bestrophin family protein
MINYNPKSWFKLIFALHKSDTIRTLWKELIYMMLFTLLINFVLIELHTEHDSLGQLLSVYSLIGFVISLLLVFRTNTAYDRWWEGRKKWGELVNDSRNLAAKVKGLTSNQEDHHFFERMIPNFVFAAKEHLRKGVKFDELRLNDEEFLLIKDRKHVPLGLVQLMYERVNEMSKREEMPANTILLLNENINSFLNSLGACERIKNTPIPYSYSIFLKKFIFVYVTTMPLALVNSFGYFASLIATYIFYVLVSMEILAEEIEDPFGKDANDLPTDQLCQTIFNNVAEVLSTSPIE